MFNVVKTAAYVVPFVHASILREQSGEGSAGATQSQPDPAEDFDDPYDQMAREMGMLEDDDSEDLDGEEPEEEPQSVEDLLAAFAAEDEGDPTDQPVDPQRNQTAAQNLSQELTSAINNMTLPDEIFDEAFNQGDMQAVRESIQKSMQHMVQQSLGLTMKPVTLAMRQMHEHLMNQIQTDIKAAQDKHSSESQLKALVPALANSQTEAMLRPMQKHLAAAGKTVQEQAKTLNAIASRLQLDKVSSGKGKVRTQSGKPISGTNALDALFKR